MKLIGMVDKLKRMLLTVGRSGIPEKDLRKGLTQYGAPYTVDLFLNLTHELGLVEKFGVNGMNRGKRFVLYRSTEDLFKMKHVKELIDLLEAQSHY
jgi:hypothetical protein